MASDRVELRSTSSSAEMELSLQEFLVAWLRSCALKRDDPAPPYRLASESFLEVERIVRSADGGSWRWKPFSLTESEYTRALVPLDREIGEDQLWMTSLDEFHSHLRFRRGLDAPGIIIQRIGVKRQRLVDCGAGVVGPETRNTNLHALLGHINHAAARFRFLAQGLAETGELWPSRWSLENRSETEWHPSWTLSRAEITSALNLKPSPIAPDLSASLIRCDLAHADLRGADLRMADLREAENLAKADLVGSWFDQFTRFPQAFGPEQAGMVFGSPVGEPVHYAALEPTSHWWIRGTAP